MMRRRVPFGPGVLLPAWLSGIEAGGSREKSSLNKLIYTPDLRHLPLCPLRCTGDGFKCCCCFGSQTSLFVCTC